MCTCATLRESQLMHMKLLEHNDLAAKLKPVLRYVAEFKHLLLQHFDNFFCRENRYLLFLTESYTALEILRHYLSGVVTSSSCVASAFTSSVDVDTDHEGVTSASTRSVDVDTNHEGVTSASTRSVDVDTDHEGVTDPKSMEPFILFGSSFPRDREYTQVFDSSAMDHLPL